MANPAQKAKKEITKAISPIIEDKVQDILKKKSAPKTKVQESMQALAEAMEERYAMHGSIRRNGSQLVVPEYMTFLDAAHALQSYHEEMEEEVENALTFVGHKYELLMASYTGLQRCFGQYFGTHKFISTFFGKQKISAKNQTIPIGPNKFKTVPVGEIKIPGLPIRVHIGLRPSKGGNAMKTVMVLNTTYRKKYEPLVEEIKDSIDSELAKNSVFKGKAIDSKFEFLDLNAFSTDKIVYSMDVEKHLGVHLFGPIERSQKLEDENLNIRRSVLLYGPFGTGKTLTALLAAKHCERYGWTFMNVLPGDSIENAVSFAEKYQPALVFFEDIDQATPHGRTPTVNAILNVVDGFLSKRSKVMIVMTSNHTENIERAMLRPGRIDAVIQMGSIDGDVITRMVKAYCPKMAKDIDGNRLLKSAEGYTQSFISEACHRSILYAMNRNDGNKKKITITNEDLEYSLKGLRPQFELMMKDPTIKPADLNAALERMIESSNKKSLKMLKEFMLDNF